jgi:hypothetical protein
MIEQGEKQETEFKWANNKVCILRILRVVVVILAFRSIHAGLRALELEMLRDFLYAVLRRKARKMLVWRVRTQVVRVRLLLPVEMD